MTIYTHPVLVMLKGELHSIWEVKVSLYERYFNISVCLA